MISGRPAARKRSQLSFDDFLDGVWAEIYAEITSCFPAGTLPEWQHMTADMKVQWRVQYWSIQAEIKA